MAKDPYHLEEDTNMARGGFPGIPGGNMQQLMRQAQKMQQDMQRMQQELQTREFTATVGGGAVRATAYGSKVIKSIEIDPACVDPDDVEMLQDLVLSAVKEAMRMAEEATNSEVSKLTGGMGLGF